MLATVPTSSSRRLVLNVRRQLEGTPLFIPARALYRAVFHPERIKHHRQMRQFYGQFIGKGDVVFDVGAAVGEYAEVFCQLGARVIAIEPNPACCAELEKLARVRDIRVEACAVGATAGTATLHLCEESNLSTLSDRWVERAAESGANLQWTGTIDVPVTPLNELARRHGEPRFVKIDVEGFEEQALAGMSFLPEALSFEFSVYVREAAYRCLRRANFAGYEFNAIAGRDFEFNHVEWLSAEQMVEWMASLDGVDFEYGDIFARRKNSA